MRRVAVVGATGVVGGAILEMLEQHFAVGTLYPLARSAGRKLTFQGRSVLVGRLDDFDFSQADLALFSAGSAVSAEHAPRAVAAGCVVVDNTSHFRMQADVPLVVPEVNAQVLRDYTGGIIANPNCSTIQMVVALKPIHDAVGLRQVQVCTYQSVSGSGRRAMQELSVQSRAVLEGQAPAVGEVYPRPIAFNVLPHIDEFEENGYTKEEMKLVRETRKILGEPELAVNPTAVRVPVYRGHAEAVHLELQAPLSVARARALLAAAPGIQLLDRPEPGGYPTPATEGGEPVYVGRIRQHHPCGLNMWIVADNLLKGAALNSVQIAALLCKGGTGI